jgi:hypothetical protein
VIIYGIYDEELQKLKLSKLDLEEEKRLQKRGPVNTRATNRQSVQETPILPALQQAPVVIMHRPVPIDAQLLSGFGGFNQGELDTLDTFFAWCENYGNEDLMHGMLKLSLSMRCAIDQHQKVFNDLRIMYIYFIYIYVFTLFIVKY